MDTWEDGWEDGFSLLRIELLNIMQLDPSSLPFTVSAPLSLPPLFPPLPPLPFPPLPPFSEIKKLFPLGFSH